MATCAARIAVAGAGRCGKHAELVMMLFSRDFEPGESVEIQTKKGMDHRWALFIEASSAGGESGLRPAVVVDPSADGPVIDSSDGRFLDEIEKVKTSDKKVENLKRTRATYEG